MGTEVSPGNRGSPSVCIPLPRSTAPCSDTPKAWKYLCYKDSWAERGWCLSLCCARCATATSPEFQECQHWEESGSAHRQAANLLLTTKPPKSLTHFVQRSCIPSLRCFGGSGTRECLALQPEAWGRRTGSVGSPGWEQRVNLHHWLHDSPHLSVPSPPALFSIISSKQQAWF